MAFMTLEMHDRIYHDGNWERDKEDGGTCLFRERWEKGDRSDAALADACQKEAAIYYAKREEKDLIKKTLSAYIGFMKNDKTRKLHGAEMEVSGQKPNGDRRIVIACFPVVGENAVDEKKMKQVIEGDKRNEREFPGLGYKLTGFKTGILRSDNVKYTGKRLFIIDINNPNLTGALAKEHEGDSFVKMDTSPEKEMTDAQKSAALKRFGMKVEGGKVLKRSGNEEQLSAAQRYLKMVDAGGTALKNKSNAQIKEEREQEEKSIAENRDAFLRELGIKVD